MSELCLKTFRGNELKPYIPELAKLRMTVFREFPYLYEGDLEYETTYLETYCASTDAFMVVLFDGDNVVGAVTGIPLEHETEAFKRPFMERGYDLSKIMYIGELLLYPEYHGKGFGIGVGVECDKRAREYGASLTAFCAVERPKDHPYAPPRYRGLDALWRKYGYRKQPELMTTYAWKDVGESSQTEKPMVFWTKQL